MYDPQPSRLFRRHPFRRIHLHGLMDTPGSVKPQSSTTYRAQDVPSQPARSGWKMLIGHPMVKLTAGLVVGVALLWFLARLVDLPATLHIIQSQITTPRGLFSAFMASVTFFLAFVVRALRWNLFLRGVGRVKTWRVIQIFLVGVFLNFLIPVRIGEVAKSLILKRIADMPIGPSLSTITIDKVFDLLPALFIVALVPLLHVSLDAQFWVVLDLANGALLGVALFVVLSAWKRALAFRILRSLLKPFPSALASKVEGFATGFVDTLLASARRPLLFFGAAGITVVAICCDGLYNYFSFWSLGYPISFGQAVLGYMLFNIFYILPSPPGQVGSNEIVGLLIFHGLLHIPAESVVAVIGLFHVWSGFMMCVIGVFNLSSLGMTFSSALKLSTGKMPAQGQDALLPRGGR